MLYKCHICCQDQSCIKVCSISLQPSQVITYWGQGRIFQSVTTREMRWLSMGVWENFTPMKRSGWHTWNASNITVDLTMSLMTRKWYIVSFSVCGPSTHKLIKNIATPRRASDLSFDSVVDFVKEHYSHKPSVIVQRVKLIRGYNSQERQWQPCSWAETTIPVLWIRGDVRRHAVWSFSVWYSKI